MAKNHEIRCSSCGGNQVHELAGGLWECESCGTKFYPYPPQIKDKIESAIAKRNNYKFDEAIEILEDILADSANKNNIECLYQYILCEYGVSFINEQGEVLEKPTLSRASNKSIEDDIYFKEIKSSNDDETKKKYIIDKLYQIDKIRQEIMKISANEKPYDVFICYKRTADKNSLTRDSVTARSLYDHCIELGYRVFFAEISLKEHIGENYEPYIYNALNTAKVMLVVAASDPNYLTADWVKNEWIRFNKICKEDSSKSLIPILANGFDAGDLPPQLSHNQGLEWGPETFSILDKKLKERINLSISDKLNKKKNINVEVKPLEIKEVTINKRTLTIVSSDTSLSASTQSIVKAAVDFFRYWR